MEEIKDHEIVVPIGEPIEAKSPLTSDHEEPPAQASRRRRHATVYDAVAGK